VSLFVIWLHIIAVAVWVGGMVFIATVLVPVIRSPDFARHGAVLVRVTGRRFRTIAWFALLVLIVTGFVNLANRGIGPIDLFSRDTWTSSFGRLLAFKLVLVGIVLAVSLIHDFVVGPRAGQAALEKPGSDEAQAMRRQASLLGRFNLVAALVIVALGVALARGCS
jgi:putative copper resistance protein D